jgi:hypothetical protein
MSNRRQQTEARWTLAAVMLLKGKKIVDVRYMTEEEADEFGWDSKAIVMQLDDDTLIFPSMDSEGNGPGALFSTVEPLVIPSL